MAGVDRHHRVCAPSQAKGHLSRVAPSTAQVAALGPSGLRAEDAVDFERMNAEPGRDQMLGGAFAAHAAGKVRFAAFRNPAASDRNGVQNNPGFGVSECRHRSSFPLVACVGGGSRPCGIVKAAIGRTVAALTGTGAVGAPVPFTKTIFGRSSRGLNFGSDDKKPDLAKLVGGAFYSQLSDFVRIFFRSSGGRRLVFRYFRSTASLLLTQYLGTPVARPDLPGERLLASLHLSVFCFRPLRGRCLRGGVCLPAAPLAGAAVTRAPAAPLFRINTGASVKWI